MLRPAPAAILVLVSGMLVRATNAHAAADTHTIFLNDCKPAGCTIHAGTTNATTDTSDIASSSSTISAFAQSDTEWQSIVSCTKDVLTPYDVTVTTQRPASGAYEQIVVAGVPGNLGLSNSQGSVGDVSCSGPGSCSAYIPKALGFVFANELAGHPDDVCAYGLQSLGVGWALDVVVDSSDVMTYAPFSGIRHFHDGEACGGDCTGTTDPFGQTCTGSGATATHACIGTGTPTQDESQTVLALFGRAPSVSISAPLGGATVAEGFAIETTCTAGSGVQSVSIAVDGTANAVSIAAAPYDTTAPATLAPGSHSVVATCTSDAGRTSSASVSVTIAATGKGKSKGCGCDLLPVQRGDLAAGALGLMLFAGALARRRRRAS